MTDQDRLERLLRAAFPPPEARQPSRDLWPVILKRTGQPRAWSWLDLGMAAAVAAALLIFPDWLWLLAYHL
jgi:hypothetical protein